MMGHREIVAVVLRHRSLPILAVLAGIFTVNSSVFLTEGNVSSLLLQTSLVGMMAIAMAVALIGGQFDLSIGATLALSGFVAVDLSGHGPLVAITGAALVGAGCGLLNGFLVGVARVNAFIATLGTLFAIRGLMLTYSDATSRATEDLSILDIAGTSVGPIPLPFLVFAALAVAAHLILTRTGVGLTVRALGGNPEFCRLNGVAVARYQIALFVLTGVSAGVSGALLVSRLGAAAPTVGLDTPIVVIGAVILGGVSLYGGVGSIGQAVGGVLVLSVLSNGMDLLAVKPYYQTVIQGAILIAVVALDAALQSDLPARLRARWPGGRAHRNERVAPPLAS